MCRIIKFNHQNFNIGRNFNNISENKTERSLKKQQKKQLLFHISKWENIFSSHHVLLKRTLSFSSKFSSASKLKSVNKKTWLLFYRFFTFRFSSLPNGALPVVMIKELFSRNFTKAFKVHRLCLFFFYWSRRSEDEETGG